MPDSEEKLFSDKYSDPGFTDFDEEMGSWISTQYKHLKGHCLSGMSLAALLEHYWARSSQNRHPFSTVSTEVWPGFGTDF